MRKAILIVGLGVLSGLSWAGEKLMIPASVTGPMTLDFVQGYRFDPLTSQPTLPSNLTIPGYPKGAKGYYIVQFAGPIDCCWKEHVNELGGFVLGYQPNYAFVVRMDGTVKAKVEALPEVRWVGLLQPAWKLFPYNLLGTGTRAIIVVLHPGESDGAFQARAKELGGTNFVWDINEVNKSVRFDVDASRIPEIASLTEVDWIEPWSEWGLDNADAQWVSQKGWRSPADTSRIIWRRGILGQDMVVGHVDDGLDTMHWAFRGRIVGYLGGYNSTWHGTHTAGTVCGNDALTGGTSPHDGMAPQARMIHKTYPPSSWDMNSWWGDMYLGNAGGRAFSLTMSLSRKDSFNLYIFTDMTADQFHWRYKDFIETNSMGNSGGNTMGHPVMAKDQISVGATGNGTRADTISSNSSRGPTADGRMKPNLVAPGTPVWSALYNTTNSYTQISGTSQSAPCVAGCAVLVRCYFEKGFYPTGDTLTGTRLHPSGALVKAVLTVGADPNITGYTVPDNNIGWGRIDLDSSLYFAGDVKRLWIYDDTTRGLVTGDSALHTITVSNSTHPFRVVMCYSDTAGPMRASRTLVNDLDLVVVSPGGTEYLGNVWSGGQSQTGGLRDSIQETECFRLNNPAQGVWTIKVRAANVPAGGSKGQPYALAVTGAVTWSGVEESVLPEPISFRDFTLGSPSPNPARDEVALHFALPRSSSAKLEVFSVAGRRVRTLAQGSHPAGVHRVRWDGRDAFGRKLPTGVYFYRLEAPGFAMTRKLLLIR